MPISKKFQYNKLPCPLPLQVVGTPKEPLADKLPGHFRCAKTTTRFSSPSVGVDPPTDASSVREFRRRLISPCLQEFYDTSDNIAVFVQILL